MIKTFSFSSKTVCYLILIIPFIISCSINRWQRASLLNWDGAAYYTYLPAVFIYQDLRNLAFVTTIDSIYEPSKGCKKCIIQNDTPRPIIKYSCGLAFLELPLFLLAHALTRLTGIYPADGYSQLYQLSVILSTIFYVFLGFWVLRKWLLLYFEDKIVLFTICILFFGSNLFYYTSYEQGLSHQYLFLFYALTLFLTDRWYKNPDTITILQLGFLIGWAILIRPTDLILVTIPIFWRFNSIENIRHTLQLWQKNIGALLGAAILLCLPFGLQMSYWKYVLGQWIYYSYTKEGFNFSDPHILDGLFNYRTGWFVYSPLLLLGFIGIFFLAQQKSFRHYLLPFVLYYATSFYVLFCWWMWFYGGFGCRVLMQSIPLLGLPLAYLIQKVLSSSKKHLQYAFFFIVFLGISLSIFQAWQKNMSILHHGNATKAYYWRVFGKTKLDQEDLKLLHPEW